MIPTPGQFLISAVCRCGECTKETFVQPTVELARVSNSPDDDQPGDYVAFIVKDLHFPEGWSIGKDLKPRCPAHAEESDDGSEGESSSGA